MGADDELRSNVRRSLFGAVAEIADHEHQRATWLDPEMQNPHYSYVEFFEKFYDAACGAYDAIDPLAEDAPLRWNVDHSILSESEGQAIWPLHEALRDYVEPTNDCYDHEAILSDPARREVCRIAGQVRDRLIKLLKDPGERVLFENVLPTGEGKRWP